MYYLYIWKKCFLNNNIGKNEMKLVLIKPSSKAKSSKLKAQFNFQRAGVPSSSHDPPTPAPDYPEKV